MLLLIIAALAALVIAYFFAIRMYEQEQRLQEAYNSLELKATNIENGFNDLEYVTGLTQISKIRDLELQMAELQKRIQLLQKEPQERTPPRKKRRSLYVSKKNSKHA